MDDKQTTLDLFSEEFDIDEEFNELRKNTEEYKIDGEELDISFDDLHTSDDDIQVEIKETPIHDAPFIEESNEVEKEVVVENDDVTTPFVENIRFEPNTSVEEITICPKEESIEIINKVEYGHVNIMVIGVGGCGCNVINRMYAEKIDEIKLVAMDTSDQTLDNISADYKILLGENIFKGHGSGGNTEKVEEAFKEYKDKIRNLLDGIDMLFVAGGIGRGTGSVGLVEIGKIARDLNVLTIGFATLPAAHEAYTDTVKKYYGNFIESVDSNIIVENDRISKISSGLTIMEAMKIADSMLVEGIKGIFELITKPGKINLDYADIKTAFSDQGSCIMGSGIGKGEDAVLKAIQNAIHSDIANIESIKNARTIIFNISCSPRTVTIDEASRGSDLIYSFGHRDNIEHLLFGYSYDNDLKDEVKVTFVATGTTPTEAKYDVFKDTPQSFVYKPTPQEEEKKKSIFEDVITKETVKEEVVEEKNKIEIPNFFGDN